MRVEGAVLGPADFGPNGYLILGADNRQGDVDQLRRAGYPVVGESPNP